MRIFEFEKLVAVLARVTRAFFFLYNDNDGARAKAKAKGGRDERRNKGQSVKNWQRICVLVSV
jgi:hypothetical protein